MLSTFLSMKTMQKNSSFPFLSLTFKFLLQKNIPIYFPSWKAETDYPIVYSTVYKQVRTLVDVFMHPVC